MVPPLEHFNAGAVHFLLHLPLLFLRHPDPGVLYFQQGRVPLPPNPDKNPAVIPFFGYPMEAGIFNKSQQGQLRDLQLPAAGLYVDPIGKAVPQPVPLKL